MPHYLEIIDTLKDAKILVVGDLILDQYSFGSVHRISPEAPIQILDIERDEYRLGGAANVARNLTPFKTKIAVSGVVGNDQEGQRLRHLLEQENIKTEGIFVDRGGRPTTLKTRFLAAGHHLLRTDREKKDPISPALEASLFKFVQENIDQYDAILLSDYAKGLLQESLCGKIISLANKCNKKVMVGPKGKNWKRYAHAFLLSANRSETESVVGFGLKTRENIHQAGCQLVEDLSLGAMLITLGAEGLYLVNQEQQGFYIPAYAREVFDVVGAGDTVLAITSLALVVGLGWQNACELGNAAAGIVVGKIGTSIVEPEEFKKFFLRNEGYGDYKENLYCVMPPLFLWLLVPNQRRCRSFLQGERILECHRPNAVPERQLGWGRTQSLFAKRGLRCHDTTWEGYFLATWGTL